MILEVKGLWGLQPNDTIPSMKYENDSIVLKRCFVAGGIGAPHEIDGIIRKENNMDILRQLLKTSTRKLKFECVL